MSVETERRRALASIGQCPEETENCACRSDS